MHECRLEFHATFTRAGHGDLLLGQRQLDAIGPGIECYADSPILAGLRTWLRLIGRSVNEPPAASPPRREQSRRSKQDAKPVTNGRSCLLGAAEEGAVTWSVHAAALAQKCGKKRRPLYCTFTALIRKSLIINGAGEGNRTHHVSSAPCIRVQFRATYASLISAPSARNCTKLQFSCH
jgi:hypothetical protein